MENQVYITNLYDYYKELLTDRQKEFFEDYYFDNLTMDEIALNNNISKNAVSKTIIEVKEKLEEYESILKLYYNKKQIESLLDEDSLQKIINYV